MYIFVSLRFRVLRYEMFLKILNFEGFEFLRMRETERKKRKKSKKYSLRYCESIVNSHNN
jgi:hypothetical protein